MSITKNVMKEELMNLNGVSYETKNILLELGLD